MRMFDVQGIEIRAPRAKVFDVLRDPGNLPQWAHAFVTASDGRARLETPAEPSTSAWWCSPRRVAGTVDWQLTFPDGSTGVAQSRVTDTDRATSIYSFVLHAPPFALEQVEGALEAQRVRLKGELATLKSLMEG